MMKLNKIVAIILTCVLIAVSIKPISIKASNNSTREEDTFVIINPNIIAINILAYDKIINNVTQETKADEVEEVVDNTSLYSENEIYELAKIIMCEAEGESQKCKEYVGQVILNRIKSEKFPDTIHDVIFDRNQFTPTFDGRWYSVEPNQDCYDAAYTAINASEPITEALYFEACRGGSSWHERNLVRVAEIDNTRFYVE